MKRRNTTIENPVITACLQTLRKLLGVDVEADAEGNLELYDLKVEIDVEPPLRIPALVRHGNVDKILLQHVLTLAELHRKKFEPPAILLCRYIPREAAHYLREKGVAFADTVGNAFLQLPNMRVWEVGNRPAVEHRPALRFMEPAGLRLLHYWLNDPGKLNEPYRTIAEECGVGLATIAAVFRDLQQAGHLRQVAQNKYKFEQAAKLLEIFVQGYAGKLRPNLYLGRFRPMEKNLERVLPQLETDFRRQKCAWAVTGDFAARIMTKYLTPGTLTIMVEAVNGQRPEMTHVMPDQHGPLTLLQLFPGAKDDVVMTQPWPTAKPLLVYAELLAEGDPRATETAGMIYERFIKGMVQ